MGTVNYLLIICYCFQSINSYHWSSWPQWVRCFYDFFWAHTYVRAIVVPRRKQSLRSCPTSRGSTGRISTQVCPTLKSMAFPWHCTHSQFYRIVISSIPTWSAASLPLFKFHWIQHFFRSSMIKLRLLLVSKCTLWLCPDFTYLWTFLSQSILCMCFWNFIKVSMGSLSGGGILIVLTSSRPDFSFIWEWSRSQGQGSYPALSLCTGTSLSKSLRLLLSGFWMCQLWNKGDVLDSESLGFPTSIRKWDNLGLWFQRDLDSEVQLLGLESWLYHLLCDLGLVI